MTTSGKQPTSRVFAVASADCIARWIPSSLDYLEWDGDVGAWVPTSAALQWKQLGSNWEISCYSHQMLKQGGQHCLADVARNSSDAVHSWKVASWKQDGLTVVHAPSQSRSIDYAHCNIVAPTTMAKGARSAARNSVLDHQVGWWDVEPVGLVPPPDL